MRERTFLLLHGRRQAQTGDNQRSLATPSKQSQYLPAWSHVAIHTLQGRHGTEEKLRESWITSIGVKYKGESSDAIVVMGRNTLLTKMKSVVEELFVLTLTKLTQSSWVKGQGFLSLLLSPKFINACTNELWIGRQQSKFENVVSGGLGFNPGCFLSTVNPSPLTNLPESHLIHVTHGSSSLPS